MREIKFRGLYRSNKLDCWAYGFPFIDKIAQISTDKCIYNVIPSTIGQFTGLKDKNGVEIYEGDIISVNGKYEKIVEFHADFFGFTLTNISDLKNKDWMEIRQRPHSQWFSDLKREIEVIGNIHQNKDLLNE